MDSFIETKDINKLLLLNKTKQRMVESEIKTLENDLRKFNKKLQILKTRALKFDEHGREFKVNLYQLAKDQADGNLKIWRSLVEIKLQRRIKLINQTQMVISHTYMQIADCNSMLEEKKEVLQKIKRKKISYDELLLVLQDI